ncbi:MAG: UDP-N-acetylmuramoyl-L-alanine--D-glutamate ligase [Clostridia bacterium]|nr:UDP-N-acetylmuramoyl-L-alanine--D-glutamate ligase [Clostridia bacterium]
MYLQQQSFLVLGLSRSGTAAAEYLLENKAKVYLYDDLDGENIRVARKKLEDLGAKSLLKEALSQSVEYCDGLVVSPGIPIDHPLAILYKRNKKAVLGETELAARALKCPCIAVTGTNGKTTTVSMLAKIFTEAGEKAVACGNIGAPMIGLWREEPSVAVAEISSFQLETLNSFRPHVAVILNISEDHLSRHYTMENYVFLKRKLLKNLTETEFAVLNYDDNVVREFAERTKARVVWFSTRERVNGAYLENGELHYNGERILASQELLLSGLHNLQNALAAVAVAKLFGLSTESILGSLSSFKGVKHRIEEVGVFDGVTYVDDSKGTNVDATLKAVACMRSDTVLLLGGKDKGYEYRSLFSGLKTSKVVAAVLYGENRYKLLAAARETGFEPLTVCGKFTEALSIARTIARKGQTVLLSPASASFDEFTGYEERGDRFVETVKEYGSHAERKRVAKPEPVATEKRQRGKATEEKQG